MKITTDSGTFRDPVWTILLCSFGSNVTKTRSAHDRPYQGIESSSKQDPWSDDNLTFEGEVIEPLSHQRLPRTGGVLRAPAAHGVSSKNLITLGYLPKLTYGFETKN